MSIFDLADAARLAMGISCDDGASPDWPTVLSAAVRERCATLAWLRSAPRIRRLAPPDVSEAWRRHALASIEESVACATELGSLLTTLIEGSVTPIVLKGQPLAVQLYTEAAARPLSDVDLFVPPQQRKQAHEVLVRNGWQHLGGFEPAEGTYRRSVESRIPHLEVHSSILDDGLLAHIRVPAPEYEIVELYGTAVHAQSGPILPLFLAVHLAKHALVPLLWWIDFDTAWRRMSPADRGATRTMASLLGLNRYLAWAEAGIDQLHAATGPNGAAATEAMRSLLDFHSLHNALRITMLADSPRQRLSVVAAWMWPPSLRHDPLAFVRSVFPRLFQWFSRTVGRSVRRRNRAASSGVTNARVIEVLRPELIDVVRAAIDEGNAVWIRVRGTSMLPTIPRIADVSVSAIPARDVRPGDVVLAQLQGGQPVIHRVHSVSADDIVLKGDNMRTADQPLGRGDMIAMADQVRAGARKYPIRPRPHWSLRITVAQWRSSLARWRSHV